jgi:hypothetical protein
MLFALGKSVNVFPAIQHSGCASHWPENATRIPTYIDPAAMAGRYDDAVAVSATWLGSFAA